MRSRRVFSTQKKILILVLLAAGLAAIIGGPAILTYTQEHQGRIQHQFHALSGNWGDGSVRFTDLAASAGLHYQWHIDGPHPYDILQTIGNGCAFLDYDNDGNLDILLVGPKLALYRGDGHGHFTDVTHQMGLDKLHGNFLGCAVGDYDNDGYDDIYISGYRTGLLLHNEKGKAFRDVTQEAGLKPQPWGTSCAWGDVDNDGKLDLYICNYLDYNPPKDPRLCPLVNGIVGACPPQTYGAERGVLYHNDGQGRFRDLTTEWGAGKVSGKALAVAFSDFDGSGRQSLAVANDQMAGDLLYNRGDHVQNVAVTSGTAYLDTRVISGMGVDWGDYDNDGRPDLFVSAFAKEPKPIYHNLGSGVFEETSAPLGLREPTMPSLTFGGKWFDFDNDGWLDLILANGHIRDTADQYGGAFLQPTLLFHNEQGQRFVDRSEAAGRDIGKAILGRGLAIGDFDNDGKVDVLIADSQGAPLLLHNESQQSGHWLSLKLVGTRSNRDGIGTAVTVVTDALTQTRYCHTDGSYLSSSDVRVHIGLGRSATASRITLHWPSGIVQTLQGVRADQQVTIREDKDNK